MLQVFTPHGASGRSILSVLGFGLGLALCLPGCGSDSPAGSSGTGGAGGTGGTAGTAGAGPTSTLDFPVDEVGPFQVGHREWEHTYQPQGVSGERTIKLHVWYPSDDTEGTNPTYEKLFGDDDVFEEASLAGPVGESYPVLVHSHGFQGYAGNSSHLMRYFASHGWVAVAPDHIGNTLLTHEDPLPNSHYIVRPQDITAALDAVAALPQEDPLSGKLATDRVVLSGHSFGTYTTWSVAGATYDAQRLIDDCPTKTGVCSDAERQTFMAGFRDGRVVAGIPMAGAPRDWFGSGLDDVPVPIMMMTGGDDPVGATELWDLVSTAEVSWVEVAGGCHQLYGFGGCENLSDDIGLPIVNTYALAFGRHHLLADTDPQVMNILDGSLEVDSRVTFVRKN